MRYDCSHVHATYTYDQSFETLNKYLDSSFQTRVYFKLSIHINMLLRIVNSQIIDD